MQFVKQSVREVNEELFGKEVAALMDCDFETISNNQGEELVFEDLRFLADVAKQLDEPIERFINREKILPALPSLIALSEQIKQEERKKNLLANWHELIDTPVEIMTEDQQEQLSAEQNEEFDCVILDNMSHDKRIVRFEIPRDREYEVVEKLRDAGIEVTVRNFNY